MQAIIDIAIDLFDRKGYAETSLADIAEAVGLLKGSLYYYAKSKEDLLYQIVAAVHAEGGAAVEELDAVSGDPADRLRRFVERGARFMLSHRAEATIYFREAKALSPDRQEELRPQRQQFDAAIRHLVQEGQATGVFRADVDPKAASLAIVGTMNWLAMVEPAPPVRARDRLARQCADFAVHALRS
jgi:AcrR family transcriptional regulator